MAECSPLNPHSRKYDRAWLRDEAIRNVAFQVVYHLRSRDPLGGGMSRDMQILDCIMEDEKYRIDITYQRRSSEKPDEPVKVRLLVTKSESEYRRLLPDPKTTRFFGFVNKSPRVPWASNPTVLLNLNRSSPFRHLEAARVFLDGTERLDGVETVRIGWSADEPDRQGASRRGLYWIAPGLGFAVVQSRSS